MGGQKTVVGPVTPDKDFEVPAAVTMEIPDVPGGKMVNVPFGKVFATRSGDKGGNANLGVFTRDDQAWAWLDSFLTTKKIRELLPEAAELEIDRHPLPALRSINFVLHGLLEEGVAASTRQDGQAKSLGEWLRARVVEIPEALLA